MVDAGPVQIKLTADGVTEVINAFKNLEAAATRLDKLSRAAQQIAKNEAKARMELAKAAAFEAQAKMKGAKQAADVEKAEGLAAVKANAAAEKEKTRAQGREIADRTRAVKKEADDEIAAAKRSTAERIRLSKQMSGRILGDIKHTLGTAAKLVTMGLGLVGGMSVANALGKQMSLESAANTAMIRGTVPGDASTRIPGSVIQSQARQLSKQYGTDATEIATARGELATRSSDPFMAGRMMPWLVQTAQAEGVPLETLANATGMVSKQYASETGKTLSDDKLQQYVRLGIGGARSKEGTSEFGEMVPFLPKITGTANSYAGNKSDNDRQLMGLYQAFYNTIGDPSRAATAVQRLSTDMLQPKNQKKINSFLQGAGFAPAMVDGRLRDPQTILKELLQASGGNIATLAAKSGLEARSFQGLQGLVPPQGMTDKKQIGEYVQRKFSNLNGAAITQDQIDTDSKVKLTEAETRLKIAHQKIDEALSKLLPTIVPLAEKLAALSPQIGKLMTSLGDLISWAVENPWEAAFAGLGLAVTKAIVVQLGAMATEKIAAAIVARIIGAALPTGIPTPAAAGAGLLSTVAQTGAVGAAATVIYGAGVAQRKAEEEANALTKQDDIVSDMRKRMKHVSALQNSPSSADRVTRASRDMEIGAEQAAIEIDRKKLEDAGALMGDGFIKKVKDVQLKVLSGGSAGPIQLPTTTIVGNRSQTNSSSIK